MAPPRPLPISFTRWRFKRRRLQGSSAFLAYCDRTHELKILFQTMGSRCFTLMDYFEFEDLKELLNVIRKIENYK